MAYDLDTLTDDCYESTTCLINKFGIRDSAQLAEMEAAITFAKSAELEHLPIKGSFIGNGAINVTHFYLQDA